MVSNKEVKQITFLFKKQFAIPVARQVQILQAFISFWHNTPGDSNLQAVINSFLFKVQKLGGVAIILNEKSHILYYSTHVVRSDSKRHVLVHYIKSVC